MTDDHQRLTATVHGRVQGVGYRAFARQRARELGLSCTATNQPDGTVEVIATGPRPQLEQLLAALGDDAPGYVERVDDRWS